MLTYGTIAGLERMALPVLFKEISVDLNLSVLSIGTIWGMDPLAGIFTGLPSGLLADRFGVKRTLAIVCILAGIFSALRGFSVNFLSMAAITFLFGFMASVTPTITPKVAALWFTGKTIGVANAFINLSSSAGSIFATMLSATVLSPWLGGWRNVLFLFGLPGVIAGLLWWFTGREPDKATGQAVTARAVPFRESISAVLRIREVWIMGFIQVFLWGTLTGTNGYLALYLRNTGWSAASSGAALTIVMAAMAIGMVPMVMLSNRLRSPKGILVFSIVVLALSWAALPFVHGNWIYVLLGTTTFLRSGATPLCYVLIFQIKGVGTAYAGTAVGLTATIGMIGSFAGPPLGNSFERLGAGAPFIFWGILCALSLPLFLLLREKPVAATAGLPPRSARPAGQ